MDKSPKRIARIEIPKDSMKTVVEIRSRPPIFNSIELIVEGFQDGPNGGYVIPISEWEWLIKQYIAGILFRE